MQDVYSPSICMLLFKCFNPALWSSCDVIRDFLTSPLPYIQTANHRAAFFVVLIDPFGHSLTIAESFGGEGPEERAGVNPLPGN